MITPSPEAQLIAVYAEFARLAAVMIGDQVDAFLAGLAEGADGPALLAAWMEGRAAIEITQGRICIAPVDGYP